VEDSGFRISIVGFGVPRKVLRTLNHKSFWEDFVNFWRYLPTKWLQVRVWDAPTKGLLWLPARLEHPRALAAEEHPLERDRQEGVAREPHHHLRVEG